MADVTREDMLRAMREARFRKRKSVMGNAVTENKIILVTRPIPVTQAAIPVTRKRGRPPSGNALSAAERQRAYRQRKRAAAK